MVPINSELLEHIKEYRSFLGKELWPSVDETDFVIVSRKTGEPMKVRQLYNLIKQLGQKAALKCEGESRARLEKFSPHWLRHLSASHQDRAGIDIKHIKENHRHESEVTTYQYIHSQDIVRHEQLEKLELGVKVDYQRQETDITNQPIIIEIEIIEKNRFVPAKENILLAIEVKYLSEVEFDKYEIDKKIIYQIEANSIFDKNEFMDNALHEAGLRGCEAIVL